MGSTARRRFPGRRAGLFSAVLLACAAVPTSAMAADRVVLISGAFRRSIPVTEFETLATTGKAPGLLGDLLRLGRQNPRQLSKVLNEKVSLPIPLVSRLLHTRIGEAVLDRVSMIVHPTRAPQDGVPALRSAVVLGIDEGGGSLSALGFLKAYPTREMAVNVPQLLALAQKASSISDLIRFFSDSPLDGLRGGDAAKPAKPAS
ncbi:MAG: alpha/beta hydrolase [Cyanobacteriota bacterium]